MRVLLASSLGGAGHLLPVAAVGRRLAAVGHDVTLLVPPALEASARTTGHTVVVGSEPERAVVDAVRDEMAAGPPEAVAGLVDRELFAERCTAAMLPAATALVAELGPDLVLRESCEYASVVAARTARIPFATVAISAARIERSVLEMVGPILERVDAGTAAAIVDAPYLTAFPASLDPSPFARTVRYRDEERAPAPLPPWWHADERPLVYVTFGSVVGHTALASSAYDVALHAVRDLDARVLVTLGRAGDPGSLGDLPPHVHVERWVDQVDVLAACDAVVCHGGSGTTMGALRAGVPLVACPLFADQSRNAATIASCGAGLAVDVLATDGGAIDERRSAAVRDALDRVLHEGSFAAAARAVAVELAGHPLVDEALGVPRA